MYLKPSQSSVAGGCVPVVVGSCDLRTYFHGLYWLWLKWGYMSHLHKYHNQRFPSRMLHCNQVISVIYITCLSVVLMLCLMVCIGVCSVSVYCLILVPSTGWSFLPSALLRELLCWHHLNWKKKNLISIQTRTENIAGATLALLPVWFSSSCPLLHQLSILISSSSNHLIFMVLHPPISICPAGSNTYTYLL